jgi:hypothetical protein
MDEWQTYDDGNYYYADANTAALDAAPLTASVGSDIAGTGADQWELGNAIVQETLGAQIVRDTQQEVWGRSIVTDALRAFNAGAGAWARSSVQSARTPGQRGSGRGGITGGGAWIRAVGVLRLQPAPIPPRP